MSSLSPLSRFPIPALSPACGGAEPQGQTPPVNTSLAGQWPLGQGMTNCWPELPRLDVGAADWSALVPQPNAGTKGAEPLGSQFPFLKLLARGGGHPS